RGKIFERDIGARAGVVEPPVSVFLDRDRLGGFGPCIGHEIFQVFQEEPLVWASTPLCRQNRRFRPALLPFYRVARRPRPEKGEACEGCGRAGAPLRLVEVRWRPYEIYKDLAA